MDALIVYPENKEQLTALKAFMKAMKISFEPQSENIPEHVMIDLKESLKQADNGELIPFTSIDDMLK